MSYWEHRKPVRRSRAVDVREIARVAVDLLDEGGLRALSIRAVAARMGVAPASLYSRVTSIDDLFDLGLDEALGQDTQLRHANQRVELHTLMFAFYRHLVQHPWACQVIAMRPPRGPHYLQWSERVCEMLVAAGASDPLGDAYALSNFVIGSATTAPATGDERGVLVDGRIAPLYASLHAAHAVTPEAIFESGLRALINR